MAELKRTFLKGRMNKDLDERLVPNGEYRDALNIDISTSEDSNVGSAQNIKGNKNISGITNYRGTSQIHSNAITVGAISDDESGKIYNFIHKASDFDNSGVYGTGVRKIGTRSDAIVEITPDANNSASSEPIIVDVYDVRLNTNTPQTVLTQITNLPTLPIQGTSQHRAQSVRVGMRVQLISPDGVDIWGGELNKSVVTSVPSVSTANQGVVNISTPVNATLLTQTLIDNGYAFKFSSKRILNFKDGLRENNALDASSDFTYTPNYNIITGINLIDDILFYTDDRTEPKKIILEKFKAVTQDLKLHSGLKNKFKLSRDIIKPLEEKDITVIKKNPLTPPFVEPFSTTRDGVVHGTVLKLQEVGAVGEQFALSDGTDPPAVFDSNTDPFNIICGFSDVNWQVGDVISITGSTTATKATVRINSVLGTPGAFNVSLIEIVGLGYTGSPEETWIGVLSEKDTIYNRKFISFAYRYKYINGEYSCVSPYSKAVFIPSYYAYNAKDGYNEGMQSSIKTINVYDFVCPDTPKDVKEVELLFKDNNDNNLYSVKTIKRGSQEFSALGYGQHFNSQSSATNRTAYRGKISINSEVFGKTLEESQLLRIFDNVPLKAKAQEINANRLMFGNYVENYDLIDASNQNIEFKGACTSFTSTQDFTSEITNDNSVTVSVENYNPNATYPNNVVYERKSITLGGAVVNTPDLFGNGDPITINFDSENDNGNNFDLTNDRFTAPETGLHNINGIIRVNVNHDIYETDAEGGGLVNNFNTGGIPVDSTVVVTILRIAGGTTTTLSTFTQNVSVAPGDIFAADISLGNSSYLLTQNDLVVFRIEAQAQIISIPEYGDFPTRSIVRVDQASFVNINPPNSTENIITTAPKESVKSQRKYQLGVVYSDTHGRETPILTSENMIYNSPKQNSLLGTKIVGNIFSKAPYWATDYRYYIKEVSNIYHNVVMYKAYPNDNSVAQNFTTDTVYAWLAFNSNDVSKIEIDDYLVGKKKHGSNEAITSTNARWRVLDIIGNATITNEEITDEDGNTTTQQNFSLGSLDLDALGATFEDISGKFFVKIQADTEFESYIGSGAALRNDANIINGAVFEVEKKKSVDLGLFYEASQAYPIQLNRDNVQQYIKVGTDVAITTTGNITDAQKTAFNNLKFKVKRVNGAINFGLNQLNGTTNSARVTVTLDSTIPSTLVFTNNPTIFKFSRRDGSFVTLKAVGSSIAGSDAITFVPFTHPNYYMSTSLNQCLPWFNCISFGNGVESDAIRDDFNSDRIYPYTASGKQSGFKASITNPDYEQRRNKNDIIFSQIYNERTGLDRSNEFLLAEPITKLLNPEYGSIQKLYSRDTDLIALCEAKVLKILANKDALFNADGESQLLSSTNVLGQTIPFVGDYGISKNPESFSVEEYRIYFADASRGAVLRLSRDGITPISDAGMSDWFSDNLDNTKSIVGSYDGDKDEYNITIYKTLSEGSLKEEYNLSFSESAKGWASFRSYIYESAVSLLNKYYTFKNGKIYSHSHDDSSIPRNNFYGNQYNSTMTTLFNDSPNSVKHFNAMEYEGTQPRIIENDQDSDYYNIDAQKGWYVESVNTDLQQGKVDEFITKEGKHFNYIKGECTTHTNAADAGSATGNLDFSEFNVQGVGNLVDNATSDIAISEGYDFLVNIIGGLDGNWTSSDYSIYNALALPATIVITLTPTYGNALAASSFSHTLTAQEQVYFTSISFADTGVAGTASNTVEITLVVNPSYDFSA